MIFIIVILKAFKNLARGECSSDEETESRAFETILCAYSRYVPKMSYFCYVMISTAFSICFFMLSYCRRASCTSLFRLSRIDICFMACIVSTQS